MKILTSSQIKELDQYTIAHEPIASIELMERAARAVARAIDERWSNTKPIIVFAGPGNNGGDALAVARILAEKEYEVSVYLFNVTGRLSTDCETNRNRLVEQDKVKLFREVIKDFDPPVLNANMIVIDGLFGTGLNKPLAGGFATLVKYINQSDATVVSIDVPSGLMSEDNAYNVAGNIIKADLTLTFQKKKLSMLFDDCLSYLGELEILNIGLSQTFVDKTHTPYYISTLNDITPLLKVRDDHSHKGMMGHGLLIAGAQGMAGAAILAAQAGMRTGMGKLTVSVPACNYGVLQTAVPEVMVTSGKEETHFTEPIDTEKFQVLAVGPGLGQNEETAIALIAQIRRATCPVVCDADAINIIASHRAWMQQLPVGIVLTPHPGEFDRLVGGSCSGGYERLEKARELAKRLQAYIILKGHYTAVIMPSGDVWFNSTGNAGMATAGSGDVLTGIVMALLARGYQQEDACKLAVYLHGLAGDLAAEDLGMESLIAGDLIRYLPKAFLHLSKQ